MNGIFNLRVRLDSLKTKILREFLPELDEKSKLSKQIREKIRQLGKHYEDGNSNCRGYTYHPIIFNEFNDISCHRNVSACEERLECIQREVDILPGDRVLDIGANVGFFSFSLAERGAIIDAIEVQTESFEIGSALARRFEASVYYINRPISVKLLDEIDHHYKAALVLSVLHWVMKQEGREETIRILRKIADRSDVIFCEVPSDPADGMVSHQDFSTLDNVKSFISEALPGFEIKEVMQSKAWGHRTLFKISDGT